MELVKGKHASLFGLSGTPAEDQTTSTADPKTAELPTTPVWQGVVVDDDERSFMDTKYGTPGADDYDFAYG